MTTPNPYRKKFNVTETIGWFIVFVGLLMWRLPSLTGSNSPVLEIVTVIVAAICAVVGLTLGIMEKKAGLIICGGLFVLGFLFAEIAVPLLL